MVLWWPVHLRRLALAQVADVPGGGGQLDGVGAAGGSTAICHVSDSGQVHDATGLGGGTHVAGSKAEEEALQLR